MTAHKPLEPLLGAREVAQALGITIGMARQLLKTELRVVQIGAGQKRRQYATTMSALEEWQAQTLRRAEQEAPRPAKPQAPKPRKKSGQPIIPEGMELARDGTLRFARKR